MPSLEDVLNTMSDTDYLHDNVQFIIDEDMRVISVPSNGVVAGVVGDKDTNRINFQMSRNYNGFDMSEFEPRIIYKNTNGDGNYYDVTDLTIDGDDILFSWLIGQDVTAVAGAVVFVVKMTKKNESMEVTNIFGTTTSSISVLETLDLDDLVPIEFQSDLLTKLENDLAVYAEEIMSGYSSSLESDIETYNNNAITKTNEFDSHVSGKITEFDSHVSGKTTEFDSHASDKTTEFDSHASGKTNDFQEEVNTYLEGKRTSFSSEIDTYLAGKKEGVDSWLPDDFSSLLDDVNRSVKQYDLVEEDANEHTSTGYVMTGKDTTANLPNEVMGTDSQWGVLFFVAENKDNKTGTQMYYPVDGEYKGRIFVRSLTNMIYDEPDIGNWTLLATYGDIYELDYRLGSWLEEWTDLNDLHGHNLTFYRNNMSNELVNIYNKPEAALGGEVGLAIIPASAETDECFQMYFDKAYGNSPQVFVRSYDHETGNWSDWISLSGGAYIEHNHDNRYYTASEIDELLDDKQESGDYAVINHDHDDRYYTESEIDENYYTKDEIDNEKIQNKVGENLILTDTVNAGIKVNKIFGKCSQGENPTSDNPQEINRFRGNITNIGNNYYNLYKQINLNIELYGIPVSSGGNYVDKNGQEYISDYIDMNTMEIVRHIAKLTDSQLHEYQTYGSGNYVDFVSTGIKADTANTLVMCNKLQSIPYDDYESTQNIDRIYGTDGTIYIQLAVDSITFTDLDSAQEFVNDLDIIYALETPTRTPLTSDQITAIKSLKTDDGMTYIFSSNAILDVDYAKSETVGQILNNYCDTNAALESKVEEIETALENKAPMDHTHSEYAASNHTHDDRYYTESEIDAKFSNFKPSTGNLSKIEKYLTNYDTGWECIIDWYTWYASSGYKSFDTQEYAEFLINVHGSPSKGDYYNAYTIIPSSFINGTASFIIGEPSTVQGLFKCNGFSVKIDKIIQNNVDITNEQQAYCILFGKRKNPYAYYLKNGNLN